MLKANLEIASRNLDCNQLINALNFLQDTLQAETDTGIVGRTDAVVCHSEEH